MLTKKFDDNDEQETLGSQGAASLKHAAITGRHWCRRTCCASLGRLVLMVLSGCSIMFVVLVLVSGGVDSFATSPWDAGVDLAKAAREPAHTLARLRGNRAPSRSSSPQPPATPQKSSTPLLPPGGKVPPLSTPHAGTPIYLSFAAFRDSERCARTLGWALEKAKYPDRLRFRVLQAYQEGKEVSCAERFTRFYLRKFCQTRPDPSSCQQDVLGRTRMWTVPLQEGNGPAHQRGLLNEFVDKEETDAFCLTTDSHMDFHHDWDEISFSDWLSVENEFAVLTAYPMAMTSGQEQLFAASHVDLCGYFPEDGIPRGFGGGNLHTAAGDRPYLTMNWAAGWSFHRCHADRNVPVDKHLRSIFTGEEIDRAVRLWTHGYDLYLPSKMSIYHNYSAANQEFWAFNRAGQAENKRISRQRLATLLELDPEVAERIPVEELGPFGLGKQRTLEEYILWSRMDLGSKHWHSVLMSTGKQPVTTARHDICQKLQRVPVRDVQLLRASAFQQGPPPGSSPETSPAKMVDLTL
mmetsp:Transcript_106611/g.318648  ORF Transcript_106611/g.318648 Transcript_106611/m.318648 type:complete len:522 (+) Transcript_106611:47-1612(+)